MLSINFHREISMSCTVIISVPIIAMVLFLNDTAAVLLIEISVYTAIN